MKHLLISICLCALSAQNETPIQTGLQWLQQKLFSCSLFIICLFCSFQKRSNYCYLVQLCCFSAFCCCLTPIQIHLSYLLYRSLSLCNVSLSYNFSIMFFSQVVVSSPRRCHHTYLFWCLFIIHNSMSAKESGCFWLNSLCRSYLKFI